MENNFKFQEKSNSHTGRVRQHNEDFYGSKETINGYIAVTCDGMGGHVGGQEASTTAVKAFISFLDKEIINDPTEALYNAVIFANSAVYNKAVENPSLKGMGTTIVALLIRDTNIYTVHAGDSRAYILTDNILHRITEDDSEVNRMVKAGIITEEQAKTHRDKNKILKAIGIAEQVEPTVTENPIKAKKGDIFMLCSDGLIDMVDETAYKIILADENMSNIEKIDTLIEMANQAGGKDNTTVQIIEITDSPHSESVFVSQSSIEFINRQKQELQQIDNKLNQTKPEKITSTQTIEIPHSTDKNIQQENTKTPNKNLKVKKKNLIIAFTIFVVFAITGFFIIKGLVSEKKDFKLTISSNYETIDSFHLTKEEAENEYNNYIKIHEDNQDTGVYCISIINVKEDNAEVLKLEYKILSDEKKKYKLEITTSKDVIWNPVLFETPEEGKKYIETLNNPNYYKLTKIANNSIIVEYIKPKKNGNNNNSNNNDDDNNTVVKKSPYIEIDQLDGTDYFQVKLPNNEKFGYTPDTMATVNCIYEEYKKLGNGKIAAKTNEGWYFLKPDGTAKNQDAYFSIAKFNFNRAKVSNTDKNFGYINEKGELVIEFNYTKAGKFQEKKISQTKYYGAIVTKNGDEIVIDENGNEHSEAKIKQLF